MSPYAYGRIVRRSTQTEFAAAVQAQDKTTKAIAALVPADVLTVHALAISVLTTTDAQGATTIIDSTQLKAVLPLLIVLTLVLYLIGRGLSGWTPVDVVRAAIPIGALIAWTALIGTSALTPWLAGVGYHALVVIGAAALGFALIALRDRVGP